MTCEPNDPRLTAFVLGELEPADRASIDAFLVDSAECRQAVEEIRLTVGWLTSRLREESRAHLESATPGRAPAPSAASLAYQTGVVVAEPVFRLTLRGVVRVSLWAAASFLGLLLVGLILIERGAPVREQIASTVASPVAKKAAPLRGKVNLGIVARDGSAEAYLAPSSLSPNEPRVAAADVQPGEPASASDHRDDSKTSLLFASTRSGPATVDVSGQAKDGTGREMAGRPVNLATAPPGDPGQKRVRSLGEGQLRYQFRPGRGRAAPE